MSMEVRARIPDATCASTARARSQNLGNCSLLVVLVPLMGLRSVQFDTGDLMIKSSPPCLGAKFRMVADLR